MATGAHGAPHHPVKGVFIQDAVHVRTHEVFAAHHVDAGIGGVRLGAAVHLVHHRQALVHRVVRRGFIHAAERLGLDFLHVRVRHLHQLEAVHEQLQGAVLGTIVHNNDLIVRIVQAQQRLHVGDDGLLLVVGRCHNGHERRIRGFPHLVYGIVFVMVGFPVPMTRPGGQHHPDIAGDKHGGIQQDKGVERIDQPLRHSVHS